MMSEPVTDNLLEACRTFLSQFNTDTYPGVPSEFAQVCLHAIKLFRGLLALACPIPGIEGSCLEDVQFLIGAAIVTEIPRVGRLIASKLKKAPWDARVSDFLQTVGAAVTHGPPLLQAFLLSEDFLQGVKTLQDDAHEYLTMLGTAKQNLPTWIENLRPLATEHFQLNLIKLLTNDLNALDDEGGSREESAF